MNLPRISKPPTASELRRRALAQGNGHAKTTVCPAHPFGPERAIFRPEWLDQCTCPERRG